MENLAKPDFGEVCKEQITMRSMTMQTDYRLDYGVSTQCAHDVERMCAAEQKKLHRNAVVFKCLIQNFKQASDMCQVELSRAVRLSLWDYRAGGALTGVCDADVNSLCSSVEKSRGVFGIGAIGKCLSRNLADQRPLAKECKQLVLVAAPKDVKGLLDSDHSLVALAEKVQALTQAAGVKTRLYNPYKSGVSVITLTGWVALLAVVSLAVVVMSAIIFIYRKLRGLDKPYTVYHAVKTAEQPEDTT